MIDPKNLTFGRGQFFSVFSLGMTQLSSIMIMPYGPYDYPHPVFEILSIYANIYK